MGSTTSDDEELNWYCIRSNELSNTIKDPQTQSAILIVSLPAIRIR